MWRILVGRSRAHDATLVVKTTVFPNLGVINAQQYLTNMASNFPEHLHAADLDTELEATLQACKSWLPTASFSVTQQGFEVCSDLPNLEYSIQPFTERFKPAEKVEY